MNAAAEIHAPAVNAELPYNPITGREYGGNNTMLLSVTFADARWAGFNQWADNGRMVRKGEKATKILMVCEKKIEDGADAKKRVCRTVSVFNFTQTEAMNAEAIASWAKRKAARAEAAGSKPAKKAPRKVRKAKKA